MCIVTLRKVFIFLFLLAFCHFALAQKITIATGEYAPYTSSTHQFGGYVNHVITKAFASQGIDVEFLYLPWKRAHESTKVGRYAATAFWSITPEREQDFIHGISFVQDDHFFYYRKDKPITEWESYEDLKGLKIGVTAGYNYIPDFWAAEDEGVFTTEEESSDLQNFRKLLAGRIDLFPMNNVVGSRILKQGTKNGVDQLKTLKKPLTSNPGYVLFPRVLAASQGLSDKFDQGLMVLKASGELQKMQEDLQNGFYD